MALSGVACDISEKAKGSKDCMTAKGNDVLQGRQTDFFTGGFRDLPSLGAGAVNFLINPKGLRSYWREPSGGLRG